MAIQPRLFSQILVAAVARVVPHQTVLPLAEHLFLAARVVALVAAKVRHLPMRQERLAGKTARPFLTRRLAEQRATATQAQTVFSASLALAVAAAMATPRKAAQAARGASPAAVAAVAAHLWTQAQRARVAQGAAASSW